MSALGRADHAKLLIDGAIGPLSGRSPQRRALAARALSSLSKAIEKHAPTPMLEDLERGVQAALEAERDASAYHAISDMAVFLADLRIRQGSLDRAKRTVEILRRHCHVRDEGFVKRQELARAAMERMASAGGMAAVVERARSGEPEAVGLIDSLEDASAPLLIREIVGSDNAQRRIHFARMLSRAGRGASSALIEKIHGTSSTTDLLRIIEALPHAAPGDAAEIALRPLLRHGTATVRRRAAAAIADQGTHGAGAALLEALAVEKDPGVRALLAENLGRLRCPDAVDALCAMADSRSESDECRTAACHALGRIGDPRALNVLMRLFGRQEKVISTITSILRPPAPPPVRAACAKALASFPASREAREALRRALSDRDPMVRSVAAQARHSALQDAFGDQASGAQLVADPDGVAAAGGKFAGILEEIPPDPLLRRIAAGEKTGSLLLNLRDRAHARIYFDTGMVVAVDNKGLPDQDAFNDLAARAEGHFLFIPQAEQPVRRVLVTVDSLLEDLERLRGG